MTRFRLGTSRVLPLLLAALACSESPTAPPQPLVPSAPEQSIFTPFLLPPGADWSQYFASFNRDRTLDVSVIHYANGTARGGGTALIPGVGTALLKVTAASADPSQGCVPNGSPCGTVSNTPEGSTSSGVAAVNGRPGVFQLHLVSHYWPNPQNVYDTATLTLCVAPVGCRSYDFYGELHHEPQ